MDVDVGNTEDNYEMEEGEIAVYQRPPSDHSLDSQPPTGLMDSADMSTQHGKDGAEEDENTGFPLKGVSGAGCTNRGLVEVMAKRKRGGS